MKTITIEVHFSAAVYVNANEQFQQIDLSFLNLKLVNVRSTEFESFIKLISLESDINVNSENFYKFLNDTFSKYVYVAIPIDLNVAVADETYRRFEYIMLIMFPGTTFKLQSVLYFQPKTANKYINHLAMHIGQMPNFPTELEINFTPFVNINSLIKRFFDCFEELKYLHLLIEYYVLGAKSQRLNMSFINLCIAYESLIKGKTELTYKLQRCGGIIVGDTKEFANRIYTNINNLYSMRSSIVHGEGENADQISAYNKYMMHLVSKSIIILLYSDIKDRVELNQYFTETGFGEQPSRFQIGRELSINNNSDFILKEALPKFKEPKN